MQELRSGQERQDSSCAEGSRPNTREAAAGDVGQAHTGRTCRGVARISASLTSKLGIAAGQWLCWLLLACSGRLGALHRGVGSVGRTGYR